MTRFDALVVGGGPAGSSCAAALHRAGWRVAVIDRARFPRDKVCAGWITPGVLRLLDLDPGAYRASGATIQEIRGFRTGVLGRPLVETRYPGIVSYAIRRSEFDDFLLRRSRAVVIDGTPLSALRRAGGGWIANDTFEAPIVIGAGGHFCPVARHLRGGATENLPIVAEEIEFPIDDGACSISDDTPELFFSEDLEGYGWCVRKAGFLNVGIGRRQRAGFKDHLRDFVAFLVATDRIRGGLPARWHGHAYLASGAGVRPLVDDGVILVGDAAGLAWPASGEGIQPAIESGLFAAQTLIDADGRWSADDLRGYERRMRRAHPPVTSGPSRWRFLEAALGRALLRSPRFTRQVVLDRWFLRRHASVGPSAGLPRLHISA